MLIREGGWKRERGGAVASGAVVEALRGTVNSWAARSPDVDTPRRSCSLTKMSPPIVGKSCAALMPWSTHLAPFSAGVNLRAHALTGADPAPGPPDFQGM